MTNYIDLTIKDILKKRSMKVRGKKKELIKRLNDHIKKEKKYEWIYWEIDGESIDIIDILENETKKEMKKILKPIISSKLDIQEDTWKRMEKSMIENNQGVSKIQKWTDKKLYDWLNVFDWDRVKPTWEGVLSRLVYNSGKRNDLLETYDEIIFYTITDKKRLINLFYIKGGVDKFDKLIKKPIKKIKRERKNSKKFTNKETEPIAKKLGLNLNVYDKKIWKYAMNVELEHGTKFSDEYNTDVTKNDPLLTGKIALAHIVEIPDYYERLKKMEEKGDKYWNGKERPDIFSKK